MNTRKSLLEKSCINFGLLFALGACHALPGTAEPWTAVNNVNPVRSEFPAAGRNAAAAGKIKTQFNAIQASVAKSDHATMLSLQQAVGQLVSAGYRLEIDSDLNLGTQLKIDTAKNWLEALGQGLSEANIELITNLYTQSATIRWNKMSLAQVIADYLPEDFTVYSDHGVNLQALIRFNPRQYWAESLSTGVADTGIDLTINYKSKFISLRPDQADRSGPESAAAL